LVALECRETRRNPRPTDDAERIYCVLPNKVKKIRCPNRSLHQQLMEPSEGLIQRILRSCVCNSSA
jgi:hypothetical protein